MHAVTIVTKGYSYFFSEGVAFIGPDPSILTFTAGQTVGDIQCSQVTILDNSVFNGERNFSIQLVEVSGGGDGDDGGGDGGGGDGDGGGDSGGGGGAQIDPNVPSIDIRIALDLPDGKSHSYTGKKVYEYGMPRIPLVVETNCICTVCAPFQSVVGPPKFCTMEVSGLLL